MRAHQVIAIGLTLVAAASAQSCGRRNNNSFLENRTSNFIVGGQIAERNEFPWQVSVQSRIICGGSIINERWIVTAATCIANWQKEEAYTIVAGSQYREENGGTTQRRKVKRIVVHPLRNGLDNDIALIELSQNLSLSRSVAPICLPEASDGDAFNGRTCVTTGWGSHNERNDPRALRKVDLPVYTNEECLKNGWLGRLTDNMLCTAPRNSETQKISGGDSGGPLACERNGVYTLAGVASFTVRIGNRKSPSVFARVSSFRKWIDSTIN